MKRIAALLLSVWLGVQLGFGYVVAPILFANLDKMVAGQLAGQLFHVSNYMGLLAWLVVLVVLKRRSAWEFGSGDKRVCVLVCVLLALFAISEFAITPTIAALKVGETTLLANWLSGSFKVWHGVSSVFHLLQSLLGLGLMVKLVRLQN